MKKIVICGLILSFVLIFSIAFVNAASDISTDSVIVKVSLKSGESLAKSVVFSSSVGGDFSLSIVGLEGVKVERDNLVISPGGLETVDFYFDSESLTPGTYAGFIRVSDAFGTNFNLPVIYEIESEDVFFDVNLDIPPQYSEIAPGGKIIAEVRIFDLTGLRDEDSLGPSEVTLDYTIKGLDGTLISFETENILVDKQARLSKTFFIPSGTEEGDYVLVVSSKYSSSLGISTYFFSIDRSKAPEFSFGSLDLKFLSVLVVMAIFFLGLIFLFVFMARDRDKLFLELKKYNAEEARKQREFLVMQMKLIKTKSPARNYVGDKEVKKQVKEKIDVLKKKQKQRVEKFKKMKKTGTVEDMNKLLRKWKGEGYNTLVLESKLKGVTNDQIKKQMTDWKKQGYKF